jgi:ABC-type amino acid transport system permease subunit
MMEWVAYFSAYLLAGLTLKIGDDLLDELDKPDLSWVPLALAGVLFGFIMTVSEYDLALITSIIIGVIASGKVNRLQFVVGFVLIFAVVLFIGIPPISSWLDWLTLVIMMFLAAVLDERGNEWTDKKVSPRAYKFFEYRFTLKVSVILISLIWPLLLPAAVGLWFFDFGYEIAGWIVRRNYSSV